jgi:protein-L-isoaspartate(D-aspartate) O-methyltransferase
MYAQYKRGQGLSRKQRAWGVVLLILGLGLGVYRVAMQYYPETSSALSAAAVTEAQTDPGSAPDKGGSSPASERHPAFGERMRERHAMVAMQIAARGVKDRAVLRAMQTVPRHVLVPERYQAQAYADHPLPIGYDQTISQPYIVAYMTEALKLDPNATVLEIGTGSGYQAAVCAEIAWRVYTIEIVEELAASARQNLSALGYENVLAKAGDGFYGWPEHAPFDAIIGTAAAGRTPPPLLQQLKPEGRMIIPQADPDGWQHLLLITKDKQGTISKRKILPVRFVPMTGQVEKPDSGAE